MIKKALTGILISVMVISALTGCGKSKDTSGTDQSSDTAVVIEEGEITEAETEEATEAKTEEVTEEKTEEATEAEVTIEATEAEVVTEAPAEAAPEEDKSEADDQQADDSKKVEYGSTIKVHFVFQCKQAGKDEFEVLEEGDKEFVVSKDTTDVFSPYDYEVEEDVIMKNVNEAIGLKTGDSFVIGCEGGDGWYETVYQILEIE